MKHLHNSGEPDRGVSVKHEGQTCMSIFSHHCVTVCAQAARRAAPVLNVKTSPAVCHHLLPLRQTPAVQRSGQKASSGRLGGPAGLRRRGFKSVSELFIDMKLRDK